MLPIDDSGAKTAPPSREKPLLLVVDDKQHNTTELVNKLSSFPLETHCTDNGRCALQLMRELQPNWVLLDMCLPDIDAYRLLNQIQADPRVCHIPLILMLPNLSSQAQLENNRLVWSRETLIKPIDPDAFKHIISLFLFMERGRRIVARMHAHHEALIDSKNEGLLGLNRAGRIVYVNNSGARLLQARPSQLVGLFMESIFEYPNRSVVSAWDEHPICTICQNKETILQVESAHFWCSQGESLPVKFAAVPVLKSTELSVVIAFRRLSATEQVTAGLKSGNPRRDALTGLSNRVDCVDVMKTLIHRAQQRNHSLSVFHVDVDHFANLNDTLGHAVGDELLVSVGMRLKGILDEQDVLARLGADEFLVAVSGLSSPQQEAALAHKIILLMNCPFLIAGHEVYVTVSVGIARFPHAGCEPTSLLQNAERATQRCKTFGRNNYHFFQPIDTEKTITTFCS